MFFFIIKHLKGFTFEPLKKFFSRRLLFPLVIFLFSPFSVLNAFTFQWDSVRGEPGFRIDVPDGWDYHYELGNHQVTFFSNQSAAELKVLSKLRGEESSLPELVNRRAAELSAHYSAPFLVREDFVQDRDDLYLAIWDYTEKKEKRRLYSAFLKNKNKTLLLELSVSWKDRDKYNVILANVLYSIQMEGGAENIRPGSDKVEASVLNEEQLQDLKQYFFYNRKRPE